MTRVPPFTKRVKPNHTTNKNNMKERQQTKKKRKTHKAKSMEEPVNRRTHGHISQCISTDADKKCAEYTETHITLTQYI